MTSQIDPTVPIFGTPTTASVRNNFLIAKNEITALQGIIVGTPGTFGPPINIGGSGPISLPSAANFFVFVNNITGTAITLTLPLTGAVGQQLIIKDIAGNAGTYTINISSGIDGNATYSLVSNYASVTIVWTGSFWGTF